MRCAECGNENRAHARFCAQCGAKLPTVAEVLPLAPDTPPAEVTKAGGNLVPGGCLVSEEPCPENAEVKPAAEELPAETVFPTDSGEAPLAAGTRLLERYEITEFLERTAEGNVYAAYDLTRCPHCGFERNTPDSEYCGECGACLATPLRCIITQKVNHGGPVIADQFAEGGSLYTVTLPELAVSCQEEKEAQGAFPRGVRLIYGQKTDVGRTREVNEDYLDARVYAPHAGPVLGSFIVADGVGGQEHGEVASRLAAETIWTQVRERIWEPEMEGRAILSEEMQEIIADAVRVANQAVYALRAERESGMGTTVTVALLRDNLGVIANVGDSRTYLWSAEGLRRLTVDHSVVEALVAKGEITREQVYTHPQRNLIYRSLGDRPGVEVDTFIQELKPGDRLVLCSDGLWEMVRDEGIADALMAEANPQLACERLVEHANIAGGEDNISVIIVQVEEKD